MINSLKLYDIYDIFLVRQQDGLSLCEFTPDSQKVPYEVRSKIKLFIKNARPTDEDLQFLEINPSNDPSRQFMLSAKVYEGILYMVLNEKSYPQKLSKLYLDDIQSGFVEELKSQFGTQSGDYQLKLGIIEESYKFQKFGKLTKTQQQIILDRYIKKKITEYQDTRSNTNIERLRNDLQTLQSTMTENIDLILDRDKTLQSMGNKASQLRESSKMFKDRSEKLKLSLLLKKYIIPIIIIGVLLLYIMFKFIF